LTSQIHLKQTRVGLVKYTLNKPELD